ncbi:MAG TPA: iron-sulfur cluster assembly scaffold protein [Candidatus Dadabacteria bacterium]|jgi:nitrogen fixation NifU-like protein|nr:iron-sulfur cluster assembly scaffold protein [Candidatus Dadabacteria bacterium]
MSADNKEKQDLMDFILDHYENPRNSGSIDDPDVEQGKCDILQKGGNPGCGDIITICLKVEDKIIKDFKFEGEGCIVSQAGTSIISEMVIGKEIDKIIEMGPEIMSEVLGEELTLSRPKCSTLGISTLKLALRQFEKKELKKLTQ